MNAVSKGRDTKCLTKEMNKARKETASNAERLRAERNRIIAEENKIQNLDLQLIQGRDEKCLSPQIEKARKEKVRSDRKSTQECECFTLRRVRGASPKVFPSV